MDWIDPAVIADPDPAHPLNGPRPVRREYLRWALAAGDADVIASLSYAMSWMKARYGQPRGPQ